MDGGGREERTQETDKQMNQEKSAHLSTSLWNLHTRTQGSKLTNLDELSFLTVLALPKASRMGFA